MRNIARRSIHSRFGGASRAIFATVVSLLFPHSGSSPAQAEIAAESELPQKLRSIVETLSKELVPRDHLHPENLKRAALFIKERFAQAGADTELQPFTVEGREYYNVIGRLGPASSEQIVIGAHYDTAGPHPGADDNASGVAGLIALAGLLGNQKLHTRFELVAYSLEEPPYFSSEQMGSAVHAAKLRQQGIPLRAMISLEMIGYFTDEPSSQHFPLPGMQSKFPSVGNFIGVVGRTGAEPLTECVAEAMQTVRSLPVHLINAPAAVSGVAFSDQLSYWRAGYPGLMITDTAFFRNPHYHLATDTAELLDYTRMSKVVEGALAAAIALDANCKRKV